MSSCCLASFCKTKKGPNQDDPKTVLDRPTADLPSSAAPPGAPFGSPKRHQTRSQNDQKSKRQFKAKQKRSKTMFNHWTRLGAILGRFGAESWMKKLLKLIVLNGFINNYFFEDKTVRSRFRDQLRRTTTKNKKQEARK